MKKRLLATLLSLVMIVGLLPMTASAASLPFTDVSTADWFYEAVEYVYGENLMVGTSTTEFSPAMTTSRGMIATILYRLEGEPSTSEYNNPFTDLTKDWYVEAVKWAAANEIVKGYGNGMYGPEDPITREQMASILWRYATYKGYDVSAGENTNILSYNDAFDISEYAISAMQWVCAVGIMEGYNGYLTPVGSAKRCEVAAIFYRFLNIYRVSEPEQPDVDIYYTVDFDYNYGNKGIYQSVEVKEGETVTKPSTPYRGGYIFDGWYTSENRGTAFDFKTPITGDLTLYAHWSIIPIYIHTHTFERDWSYNETIHWHAATCGHNVTSGEGLHDFGGVVDCTQSVTCSVCGYVKPAGQHIFNSAWTNNDTEHSNVCATCGTTVTSAHDWTAWGEDSDRHSRSCTVCAATENEAHTWIAGTMIESTCTDKGSQPYSCFCGATKADEIAAKGHDFESSSEYKENPTADGHEKKCARCSEYDTLTAHSYNVTDSTQDAICSACGYIKLATTALVHNETELNTAISKNKNIILGASFGLNHSSEIEAGKTISIDLNGYEISVVTAGTFAFVNNGTLTITDTVGGGSITARIGVDNYGTLVLNGGTIVANEQGGAAIYNNAGSNANFTMNGGTLKATFVGSYADSTGGACIRNTGDSVTTITGGTLESRSARTYAIISNGTLNITPAAGSDVTMTAYRGIAIDDGTANINGGTFTVLDANAEEGTYVAYETYYALYVGGNDSVVTVNGGTFTAPDSSVWRPDWDEVATDLVINGGTFNGSLIGNAGYYPSKYISVKGGTFDEDPTSYLATGYVVSDNGDGTFTVSAAQGN